VADRTNKRRALLVTQSLEMAQSATLAVLAFLPHPSLVVLYAMDSAANWHDFQSDFYYANKIVNTSNQTLASCQDSNGTNGEVTTFQQKQ
jgi:hypothetical protein